MESRWKRLVDDGPAARAGRRPARSRSRLRGGDSARRVVALDDVAIDGLVRAVHRRGPLRRAHRARSAPTARARRTSCACSPARPSATTATSCSARASRPGLFTQLNARADFAGRKVIDVVRERVGALRAARWARWPATGCRRRARAYETLSRRPAGAPGDPLPRARGPQPAAARRAHRQPRHRLLPRRSRRRSTASRARSSPSPTTARSCARSTASCCSTTTATSRCCPTRAPRWRPSAPRAAARASGRRVAPALRGRPMATRERSRAALCVHALHSLHPSAAPPPTRTSAPAGSRAPSSWPSAAASRWPRSPWPTAKRSPTPSTRPPPRSSRCGSAPARCGP